MRTHHYPSDITDAQWALIELHIPPVHPGGLPRKTDVRDVLDAILYIPSAPAASGDTCLSTSRPRAPFGATSTSGVGTALLSKSCSDSFLLTPSLSVALLRLSEHIVRDVEDGLVHEPIPRLLIIQKALRSGLLDDAERAGHSKPAACGGPRTLPPSIPRPRRWPQLHPDRA